MRRVRQVHRLDRRAERLGQLERLVEGLQHARLDALAGELLRDAEADALEVGRASACVIGSGRPMLVLVARVGADHRAQQQRGVGDVAGERARLVERRREGDHPVAADRAVGGLQPDDPAQRGGLADRAAGVGADASTAPCPRPPRPRRRRTSRPGRAWCPTGSASGRTRCSRSRSPSRTRPGWSCPAACRRPRRGCGRSSPCTAAGSPRGSSSRPGSGCPRCRRGP